MHPVLVQAFFTSGFLEGRRDRLPRRGDLGWALQRRVLRCVQEVERLGPLYLLGPVSAVNLRPLVYRGARIAVATRLIHETEKALSLLGGRQRAVGTELGTVGLQMHEAARRARDPHRTRRRYI